MFTDDLLESQLDEIHLNGVTALGMKKLINFAYSSKIVIDAGNYLFLHLNNFTPAPVDQLPTGDQEVAGSTPVELATSFS